MSFMPNVGTVVRMTDGRIAIVSDFKPLGGEKVMYVDGHEENTDAWKIAEMLTDEDEATSENLLAKLKEYIAKTEVYVNGKAKSH